MCAINMRMAFNLEHIQSYFDSQGPQPWSHHYIVTGHGGVRTDFVASWLATITELFNPWPKEWNIDPVTGASVLAKVPLFDHHKSSDQVEGNRTINGFTEILQSTYDSTALKSVSKSHVSYQALDHYVPHIFKRDFTVAQIVYPTNFNDVVTVSWEYIVKTFLRRCNHRQSHTKLNLKLIFESRLTNIPIDLSTDEGCQRAVELIIDHIVNNIIKVDGLGFSGPNLRILNHIPLEYSRISSTGGGQYIADRLGIDIDPWYFDLYDRAVSIASSPVTITAFGKTWYKNDLAERIKHVF